MHGILQGGWGNQLFIMATLLNKSKACTFSGGTNEMYPVGAVTPRTVQALVPVQTGTSRAPVWWEPTWDADSTLDDIPVLDARYLGYFQHWRFVTPIPRELAFQVTVAHDTGIHVRRTDYTQLAHVYHQLGKEYYGAALHALQPQGPVLVFSDEDVMDEVHAWQLPFQWVRFSRGEADDFRAMASCNNLVIANSTFSWWAAHVGDTVRTGRVVAPLLWYTKNNAEPLRKPNWTWL